LVHTDHCARRYAELCSLAAEDLSFSGSAAGDRHWGTENMTADQHDAYAIANWLRLGRR